MPVPAQTPHLVNNVWIVFIKDSAFSMLYDVYLRNFDVNDRQRKEYSVLWFRQMWKKLNDLAGTTHPLTLSIEDIENSYNPSRPLYGKLQFEAKIIYSRNDGKYYHILVVDSFNYTLPYTDYYGGKRVIIENKQYNTMKNTRNKVRLTESQPHQVINESVRKVLKEASYDDYKNSEFYTERFKDKEYEQSDYDERENIIEKWVTLKSENRIGDFMAVLYYGRRPESCICKGSWRKCCCQALATELQYYKNDYYRVQLEEVRKDEYGDTMPFASIRDEYDHCWEMGDFDEY